MDYSIGYDWEQKTLERVKLHAVRYLQKEGLGGPDTAVDAYLDVVLGDIVFELKRRLWAENMGEVEVLVPDTWWDAFKEAHFPPWAVRRWPANFRRIKFSARAEFPDYRPPDSLGRYVYFGEVSYDDAGSCHES